MQNPKSVGAAFALTLILGLNGFACIPGIMETPPCAATPGQVDSPPSADAGVMEAPPAADYVRFGITLLENSVFF